MNDMWLTSSHGRAVSFDALAAHRKVAMVTDGRCGPREIAAQLMARGKGHRWMVIGENRRWKTSGSTGCRSAPWRTNMR